MNVRSLTLATLVALVVPSSAAAQQPLRVFLQGALEASLDARAARAEAARRGSAVDRARADLLPSVTVSGGYSRNQQEVVATFPDGAGGTQDATITARDQFDTTFRLDVPLLDVSAWSRFFRAESEADAAALSTDATVADVAVDVVNAYYRLLAARAVQRSARGTLETAERELAVTQARREAGLASELDLARASRDAAQAEQAVGEADLEEALARRQLVVLTGVEAEPGSVDLADDLAPEPPLEAWMGSAEQVPSVQRARAERNAAGQARDAAWQALLPVLTASAEERYTNAAGFGPDFLWAVGVRFSWTLDFGRPASFSQEGHALAAAEARYEQARLTAETRIYEEWHRVRSLLVRARASRAAAEASERAARVARADYEAGTATQLELSQAERDRFEADVSRIRADADLAIARFRLRLRVGLPPEREARP